MITQPLRDEHRELLPHVERLREAADLVGSGSGAGLGPSVRTAAEFLTGHLIPHAQAEDRALYPVVEQVLGATGATATMKRDHQEVGALTAELVSRSGRLPAGRLAEAEARELRRLLYGLYALVKVHFAKEEEVYLPLLDSHLSSEEGRELFEAMEREAAAAHRQAHANAGKTREGGPG